MATVREKFDQVNTKFGEIASELLAKQDKDGDKQLTADDFVANSTHLGLRAGGTQKTDVGLGSLENYGIASKDDADMGLASDKKLTPKKNKDHSLSKISFGAVAPDNNDGKPDGTLHFQAGEWSLIFVKHNGEYREIKDFWFKHNGVWVNKYVPNVKMAGAWLRLQPRKVSLVKYGFIYNSFSYENSALPSGFRTTNYDDLNHIRENIINEFGEAGSVRRMKHRRAAGSPLGDPWTTDDHPRFAAHSSAFGLDNYLVGILPAGWRDTSRNWLDFGAAANIRTAYNGRARIRHSSNDSFSTIGTWTSDTFYARMCMSSKVCRNATSIEQALPNGTLLNQIEDIDGNIYDEVKVGSRVYLVQYWACTKDDNGEDLFLIAGTNYTGAGVAGYGRPGDVNGMSHFANEEESIWNYELMQRP